LKEGSAAEQQLVTSAIAERDAGQIDAIVAAVKRCGALEYTLAQAKKYADLAAFEVESFAQSSYHRAMAELCQIAVERDR
jgi:octaprenyl-diphosphate synthase